MATLARALVIVDFCGVRVMASAISRSARRRDADDDLNGITSTRARHERSTAITTITCGS
jgi:hypothetical protein